jgi:dihydrofolate reductase
MTLSIIVAMARNRVIGHQNKLPWHLSEDLKHFKETTLGHPIVMGRKTYESIGKPLPGRENIVLTRNQDFQVDGVVVIHDLSTLEEKYSKKEIFIIGGAEIYRWALPRANRLLKMILKSSKRVNGCCRAREISLTVLQ